MFKKLIKILRNPVVQYESIWLRLLVAFLVAQLIINLGQPRHGYEFYTSIGYHRGWLVTFFIAFFVMQWIYWQTVYLDWKYPWADDPKTRKRKQIIYGVGVPLLFDFVVMTIFFACFGYNIFKTRWPSLYFPVTLFMLCILNFYYHNRYKIFEKEERIKRDAKARSMQDKAERSVQKVIDKIEKVYYYFRLDRKVMAILSTGEMIATLYDAIADVDLSSGELMYARRECLVAWENIISARKVNRRYIITLKFPENEVIRLSRAQSVKYRDRLNDYM